MKKEVHDDILKFLKASGIMTLATHSGKTWVCTVYYGIDDTLNLYIVTNPNSQHGKDIKKNPNVAFAVFDSHTKITDQKKGIQGQGVCAIVQKPNELDLALRIWHKANPGVETRITLEALKTWPDTKIYKIQPTKIKFFNKQLYGDKEYAILEF